MRAILFRAWCVAAKTMDTQRWQSFWCSCLFGRGDTQTRRWTTWCTTVDVSGVTVPCTCRYDVCLLAILGSKHEPPDVTADWQHLLAPHRGSADTLQNCGSPHAKERQTSECKRMGSNVAVVTNGRPQASFHQFNIEKLQHWLPHHSLENASTGISGMETAVVCL